MLGGSLRFPSAFLKLRSQPIAIMHAEAVKMAMMIINQPQYYNRRI